MGEESSKRGANKCWKRGGNERSKGKKRKRGEREEEGGGSGDSTGVEKPGSQIPQPAINRIPAAARLLWQGNHSSCKFLRVEKKNSSEPLSGKLREDGDLRRRLAGLSIACPLHLRLVTEVGDKVGRGEGVQPCTQQPYGQVTSSPDGAEKGSQDWREGAGSQKLMAQGRAKPPAGDRTQEALAVG